MQQHGSKFLSTDTHSGCSQKVKIQLFSEHGHVVYQIKWNNECRPWGRGQNSTFSEYCSFAYRIKWKHECSNMQAHILSLHTLDPWVGVKVQNISFSESSHVAY